MTMRSFNPQGKNICLLILLCVLALSLLGCAKGVEDIDATFQKVRSEPSEPIDPLPVMKDYEIYEYAAYNLRDPFDPARRPSELDGASTGLRPDADRVREPLESFPLDTMDMVGTLAYGDQVYGLIQDPDGLVHRLQPDNYIGQNYGRIVNIMEDRIELVELVSNGAGGWIERQASIALKDQ